MAFQKGQSGNPRGRPRGLVNQAKLREAIVGDVPDILSALAQKARDGDTAAAKLLLDRVLPALKPQEQPISLPLADDDLAASGRAVLAAVGGAAVTPDQAAKLLQGLGALARVVETDELAKRVERLEHAAAANGDH